MNPTQYFIFLLTLCGAMCQGMTYEKKTGAFNPAIDGGDNYEFACQPGEIRTFVNTKGDILKEEGKKKKKIGVLPTNIPGGFYLTYLECFVVENTLLAAYAESNGEDGGVTIRRCSYHGKKCQWTVDLLASDLEPPVLAKDRLKVTVKNVELELDVKDGTVKRAAGAGCVFVDRRDSARRRSKEYFGDQCKAKDKQLK